MVLIITTTPWGLVGVSLWCDENDGDIIPFRIGLEFIIITVYHRIHMAAHHVHGKNQPIGCVLIVIFGNVDGILAGKTGALHSVGSTFEIPKLFAGTGAENRSVLQFMSGINGY